MKTKTKSFSISDQTIQKMEEIRQALGLTSMSSILALAINMLHKSDVLKNRLNEAKVIKRINKQNL